MIDIRQLVLKITDLISIGRDSLQYRGVETEESITVEEIFEKIKEIPIYNFGDRAAGSQTEVTVRRAPTYVRTDNATPINKPISATTEIEIIIAEV